MCAVYPESDATLLPMEKFAVIRRCLKHPKLEISFVQDEVAGDESYFICLSEWSR